MRFTHDLHVAAPAERVWSLTVALEEWPALTPTMSAVIRRDVGPLAVGSTAWVRQPRMRPATWTVTTLEPPRRLAWRADGPGIRMSAEHRVEEENAGARNTLVLDLSGPAAAVLGRVGGPALRGALATENDGFRRAAEGLARPPFVDEHRVRVDVPPAEAWPVVRHYAEQLATGASGRHLTRLLGTSPASGFEIREEVAGSRVGLGGRHRFSRYWLDLRVDPVGGAATEVAAVTYADFPGPHGRAYRTAVVGTRLHVLAVRRMLVAVESAL